MNNRQKEVAKTIEQLNDIIEFSTEFIISEEQKNTLILTVINASLMQISETLAIICDKMKEGE